MTSKVIEVDFLKKDSSKDESSSIEVEETKEQKLLRLSKAIEKGEYLPNLEDVADAILTDLLLDESAKTEE